MIILCTCDAEKKTPASPFAPVLLSLCCQFNTGISPACVPSARLPVSLRSLYICKRVYNSGGGRERGTNPSDGLVRGIKAINPSRGEQPYSCTAGAIPKVMLGQHSDRKLLCSL